MTTLAPFSTLQLAFTIGGYQDRIRKLEALRDELCDVIKAQQKVIAEIEPYIK